MTTQENITKVEYEKFIEDYQQEIAHIYDLFQNVCTFKKIRFYESSAWTQSSDGYYKLQLPCTECVAFAAFESIEGGTDKRANCIADPNKKYAVVTSTYPFDGYFVVADISMDDDDTNAASGSTVTVDRALSASSLNPVTNKAVTVAINSLIEQVAQTTKIPASLPASDVYSWAKAKSKPCYSWDEICGKPQVVTEITYRGHKLPYVAGQVSLDKLDAYFDEKKLSEFVCDLAVKDLTDGVELLNKVDTVVADTAAIGTKLDNHIADCNTKLANVQADCDDLNTAYSSLNSQFSSLKGTVSSSLRNLSTDIETAKLNCLNADNAVKAELQSAIDELAASTSSSDESLQSQMSTLANECRLQHEMYSEKLASMAGDIAKLQTSSAEALVDLIKQEIAVSEKDIAKLTTRVQALEDAQLTITKPEGTNGIININGTDMVVYDDSVLQTNVQTLSDDVDAIEGDIVTINENATALSNKIAEVEAKLTPDTVFTELNSKIEDNATSIVNIEKELSNAAAASGLKIVESETNGYVKLLYPKKDEEGNVVYDKGEVVYDEENPEEIKVYELSETLDKFETEAAAALTTRETVLPTKLSELTNDMSFVTRKQAAGLVASAQVNFDTAFEDDDPANITYVKTVNISDSQGSVLINGDNIKLQVDGIGEMETAIQSNADNITAMQTTVTEQAETIAKQAETIAQLQTALASAQEAITQLQTVITTFVDANGTLDEGEVPLWEKQNMSDAVTDSDAMGNDEITKIFNDAE